MTAHPSGAGDVLLIGGGPAGVAAAIPLARAAHRVLVIERDPSPRPHGYHALLTPRALTAVRRLGIDGAVELHRIDRIRLTADDRTSSTGWPDHPDFPDHAATVRRDRFDHAALQAAADAGVTVLDGHEATGPIIDRGFVRGANVIAPDGTAFEARAAFTVVADGANSRFGRALGTFREPSWPFAIAQSATFRSALHAATEIELVLDLHDKAGHAITGYGWLFPGGDGTVNVGVLVMSTSPSFQVINPVHLHEQFVDDHRAGWHLDGAAVAASASGRIPLGTSVGPAAGPTYLLVGDAVGAANPLSGSGVDAALETGLLAADVLDQALGEGTASALQQYPKLLAEHYGSYYKAGRLATRVLGQPTLSHRIARAATGRRRFSDAFVRIAGNELRPGRGGAAELAYRMGRAASLIAPDA